ncbi:carbamoyltransferase HypF [Frankia sp. BMG5.23]|uniref:carbamoyltransferase HypF n=1 Tax=Frankia sp. BMG5.23 TaxID=683305 RepID=UPI001F286C84|nr:carbamoyltransferase HypF [Frankia sp. BMG5.23]
MADGTAGRMTRPVLSVGGAGEPSREAGPGGRARRRFVVQGLVQGVGFRPFVHAAATELALTGWVRNDTGGVVAEVEGTPGAVEDFARRLRCDVPPLAMVERVVTTELPPCGGSGFAIVRSRPAAGGRTAAAPDVATCPDCLRELADPADRRYRHPFITCTNCGPRFTIITDLPYDRPATTMARFAMCPVCEREYSDPADRRFHAQPIACPACGPRLEFVSPLGAPRTGEDALAAARRLLADGGVLAVKGVGGYHLACVATDPTAVTTLRRRKRRGGKPFAVMVHDLAAARALAHVDEREAALLTDPARPIVLVRRRRDGRPALADSVAPDNPDLGLLLPYTPVHHLLLGLPGEPVPLHRTVGTAGWPPLVMTSGNLGGEPIAAEDTDALRRLAPLVDGWLRHDRPIRVPCDDSVVRVVDGAPSPVRRSRGYAPLPVPLPFEVPPTLAVGADLKNTCGLGAGRSAWLSGHIGDMDDLATLRAFDAAERHLEHLTGVTPRQLVTDAHPGYRSRQWAVRHAAGRPIRTVQHHHAHVAALMAEHGLDGTRPVVGFAFDGTGYGPDRAVWGGEVLIADYRGFRRFAHLGYVPLAGGDAAVRRPCRMALAHLHAAGVRWDPTLPPVVACPQPERRVLTHQLASGLGCVPTSSMGRLFDAVSSLLGIRHEVDFEAQAAIELEARARTAAGGGADDRERHAFALRGQGLGRPLIIDPAPVIRAMVRDLSAGLAVDIAAVRFHIAVVAMIVDLARRARGEVGLDLVGLTGGVFQNAVLTTAASRALHAGGFTVLRHARVPPNDGGIALGQLLVAAAREKTREKG